MLLHPRSKGYLKLKSRNPFHHPLFYPNFFADSRDIDSLIEGIRESIRIVEQPEFRRLGAKLYNVSVPGCENTQFKSDEYWRCYIQHLSATFHHQSGSCKMGPASDVTAIVDAKGLVHGFKNLRVADISILPESPSGHSAAFSFLIGEKISDSILCDWQPKGTNIQKLVRVRKAIDWLYQDPEHTTRTQENSTYSTIPKITTHRPIHLLQQVPSVEMMHVLHSLNMSALHEQSQQFKYSTIGDVGTILWGSSSITRTIDFKSKLAENTNSSLNQTKPKILKRIQITNVIQKVRATEKNVSLLDDAMQTSTSTIDYSRNSTDLMTEKTTNETDKIETETIRPKI